MYLCCDTGLILITYNLLLPSIFSKDFAVITPARIIIHAPVFLTLNCIYEKNILSFDDPFFLYCFAGSIKT